MNTRPPIQVLIYGSSHFLKRHFEDDFQWTIFLILSLNNLIVCFQQGLLSLATQLIISLLVADAVCASNNDEFKVRLFSSTLLMNGVTTLAMVFLGVRYLRFMAKCRYAVISLEYSIIFFIISGSIHDINKYNKT